MSFEDVKVVSVSQKRSVQQLKEMYKNSNIIQGLGQLGERYKSFRNIRGDGNCFIRAAAFSYITSKNYSKAEQIFP